MTVRNVTLKDVKELGVLGEIITLQFQDGNIEAVTIKYKDASVRITKNGSYSETLKLSVEKDKEIVKKWKLSGCFMGLTDVEQIFDDKYEAQDALNKFESKAGYEEVGLAITEVEVEQLITKLA